MPLKREIVESILYGRTGAPRFTQDSPILLDVWIEYAQQKDPTKELELLITPYQDPDSFTGTTTPGELSRDLIKRLEIDRSRQVSRAGIVPHKPYVAYNQTTVLAKLTFEELVRVVLPMCMWWNEKVCPPINDTDQAASQVADGSKGSGSKESGKRSKPSKTAARRSQTPHAKLMQSLRAFLTNEDQLPALDGGHSLGHKSPLTSEVLWLIRLIGTIAAARNMKKKRKENWPPIDEASTVHIHDSESVVTPATDAERIAYRREVVRAAIALLNAMVTLDGTQSMVWSVSLNRKARMTISRSRSSIKADAATNLFNISCKDLAWAVIDSGIDARHMAFRKREADGTIKYLEEDSPEIFAKSRVVATFDFTIVGYLLSSNPLEDDIPAKALERIKEIEAREPDKAADLRKSLQAGRDVDWHLLEPFITVPHSADKYQQPTSEHGTHVAGIIGADCPEDAAVPAGRKEILKGMCPDIRLYDLRVLDAQGAGDEFNVMAALQFVRYMNAHREVQVIHGVNLSLSIRHDVANFACGRTPVCDECERLVGAGIIVVAAAGNEGYLQYLTGKGPMYGYRSISITDPGNAEGVITVGSTHRFQPHTYGVSYFSSRGPTGDGRTKPDLVAPGEKIKSTVPDDGYKLMDGTSMAAPHVSGAAALLIARHRELAGQPIRVKNVLCQTATDLGRERYFQGHGMVDVLRALQSV